MQGVRSVRSIIHAPRRLLISAFDLFKIGIGPSSSHTIGPMIAAGRFRARIASRTDVARVSVELFGQAGHDMQAKY